MRSIIEELYYGNLEPMELNNNESGRRLKRKLSELSESETEFAKALSEKEKEILSKYMEQCNEFTSLSCADSFVTGFKLGARFACEMFT